MNDFFLSSLSKALNRYLALDPESARRLSVLAGKTVAMTLLPFQYTFYLTVNQQGGIALQAGAPQHADTRLTGTPLQLMGMILARDQRHRFFADDVKIEGDAELGQQMIALFDELDIDWEDQLAKLTGDVPAFHAGQAVNKACDWLRQVRKSLLQQVSEYVQEEKQILPTSEALQDFYNDIDQLRMDTDRLAARINRLSTPLRGHNREND
ncbi:MAG TPA: SCP2 sterol-binding domain-containing protein [Gammaproteobacteria bacterium]|jgi:ubiquinone biosynthesis protein UbiJ|nr:SCP2 sterol-binding domain-containing protein [Gammaproteobacteria bacterium]